MSKNLMVQRAWALKTTTVKLTSMRILMGDKRGNIMASAARETKAGGTAILQTVNDFLPAKQSHVIYASTMLPEGCAIHLQKPSTTTN